MATFYAAIFIICIALIARFPILLIFIGILIVISIIDKYLERKRYLHKQFTLQQVDNMEGLSFENYVATHLLPNNGFYNCQRTKGSGDYGVDVIAYKNGKKYVLQCKRYNGKVSNKAVQEIFSGKAYYNADFAIVLTNSYFTKNAINLAKKTKIILWDRDNLYNMMNKNN